MRCVVIEAMAGGQLLSAEERAELYLRALSALAPSHVPLRFCEEHAPLEVALCGRCGFDVYPYQCRRCLEHA